MLKHKKECYKAATMMMLWQQDLMGSKQEFIPSLLFKKFHKGQTLFNYFLNVVLTSIYFWSYAQCNELMLFSNHIEPNIYH